jgi:hypothetical protein
VFGARSMVVVVAVVLSSIIIINGFGALLWGCRRCSKCCYWRIIWLWVWLFSSFVWVAMYGVWWLR